MDSVAEHQPVSAEVYYFFLFLFSYFIIGLSNSPEQYVFLHLAWPGFFVVAGLFWNLFFNDFYYFQGITERTRQYHGVQVRN